MTRRGAIITDERQGERSGFSNAALPTSVVAEQVTTKQMGSMPTHGAE
jgi:hypothetical protein